MNAVLPAVMGGLIVLAVAFDLPTWVVVAIIIAWATLAIAYSGEKQREREQKRKQ